MYICVPDDHNTSVMKQLSEAFTGAGFLIIKLACSDYDFPTVQWWLSVFTSLDSSVDLFILKTLI